MNAASKSEDSPRFRAEVTRSERCHRSVEVEVPGDVVAAEHEAVLRTYRSRVKLKGFRKGKAPLGVLRQRYGPEIRSEAVERAVQRACRQALDSKGLHPMSDVDVADLSRSEDGAIKFTASFEVRPEVNVGRLGGFKLERPPVTVPDDAVDRILERLQKERAVWRTASNGQPEEGDSVTVLLTRLDGAGREAQAGDGGEPDGGGDGEARQYDLVLGERQALPDVEEAIRTLAVGGANEFEVAFPDDHPDENRAGTVHRLKIELVSRRVAELPDLDDAFAGSIGDFDDLAALRARIGEDLERDAKERAEAEFRERLLNMVVEANPFDVPDAMVDVYASALIRDAEELTDEQLEQLKEELRPGAEFMVRRELLVERIVAENGLGATEEEVGERVREIAREAGQSPSAVRSRLRESGALGNLERSLTDAKLFAFLMAESEIEVPD